jgi:hypothetical protein
MSLPLYPQGKSPRNTLDRLGVLSVSLDDLEKRKFLPPPGLELDPSVVQSVASRYTDYGMMWELVLIS